MTDLERLELVLRRVRAGIVPPNNVNFLRFIGEPTHRNGEEVLDLIIDELTRENAGSKETP
jgi:hypothetical protein